MRDEATASRVVYDVNVVYIVLVVDVVYVVYVVSVFGLSWLFRLLTLFRLLIFFCRLRLVVLVFTLSGAYVVYCFEVIWFRSSRCAYCFLGSVCLGSVVYGTRLLRLLKCFELFGLFGLFV